MERKKLEALAAELGIADSVFFLGWVNDLDSFYGALDINTLSSLSEAFPYALPEGARAHLATVASNVGGVPAIIEHGVTGLLIEPGDVRMLAAYLARFALRCPITAMRWARRSTGAARRLFRGGHRPAPAGDLQRRFSHGAKPARRRA